MNDCLWEQTLRREHLQFSSSMSFLWSTGRVLERWKAQWIMEGIFFLFWVPVRDDCECPSYWKYWKSRSFLHNLSYLRSMHSSRRTICMKSQALSMSHLHRLQDFPYHSWFALPPGSGSTKFYQNTSGTQHFHYYMILGYIFFGLW